MSDLDNYMDDSRIADWAQADYRALREREERLREALREILAAQEDVMNPRRLAVATEAARAEVDENCGHDGWKADCPRCEAEYNAAQDRLEPRRSRR